MISLTPQDQIALLTNLLSPDAHLSLLKCSKTLTTGSFKIPPAISGESYLNLIGFVGVLIELNLIPTVLEKQISTAYAWASSTQWLEEMQFQAQQEDPRVPKIVDQPRGFVVGVAIAPDVILSKDEYMRRSFVELLNEFALTNPVRMAALLEHQLTDSDGQNFA